MKFNDGKTFVDLSLRDKVQPYLHKEMSRDCPDRIVSLKEKCLGVIRSDSNLIARLLRDHDDSLSMMSSNPIFLKDLHLEQKAKYIDKEDFYKDQLKQLPSYAGKENGRVTLHGHSWKRMYMEEMFTTLLNNHTNEEDSVTLPFPIESFQDYIFTLELKNFSNFTLLDSTLPSLTNLTSLTLEYGNKRNTDLPLVTSIQQRNGRSLFGGGMQISDAQSLAHALKSLPHLCSLSLTNSQINDEIIFALFDELQSSHGDSPHDHAATTGSLSCLRDSLIDLDLSFNKIHKDGFYRIVQYFFPSSSSFVDHEDCSIEQDFKNQHPAAQQQQQEGRDHDLLVKLKLTGNDVGIEGARILRKILEKNTSLQELDVRLNDLKDEGGCIILEALHHNRTLKMLNMACNSLSTKSANSLCSLIGQGDGNNQNGELVLEILDLSCNMFADEDFTNIAAWVSSSSSSKSLGNLIELDLRGDYNSLSIKDAIATIEARMISKRRRLVQKGG